MTDTTLATSVRQRREATVREHVDAENRQRPGTMFPVLIRTAKFLITPQSASC